MLYSVTGERWIGKDLEGMGHGIIRIWPWHLLRRTEENNKKKPIRSGGVATEVQSDDPQTTSAEHYRYTNMFGNKSISKPTFPILKKQKATYEIFLLLCLCISPYVAKQRLEGRMIWAWRVILLVNHSLRWLRNQVFPSSEHTQSWSIRKCMAPSTVQTQQGESCVMLVFAIGHLMITNNGLQLLPNTYKPWCLDSGITRCVMLVSLCLFLAAVVRPQPVAGLGIDFSVGVSVSTSWKVSDSVLRLVPVAFDYKYDQAIQHNFMDQPGVPGRCTTTQM
jgi:hypothetical protein